MQIQINAIFKIQISSYIKKRKSARIIDTISVMLIIRLRNIRNFEVTLCDQIAALINIIMFRIIWRAREPRFHDRFQE